MIKITGQFPEKIIKFIQPFSTKENKPPEGCPETILKGNAS